MFLNTDDHMDGISPCLNTPLSRVPFCRQPLSFIAHRCSLSPHVANCSLLSLSAELSAFPNHHCDMHTPHMMMSISKSLPRNSGENPEHLTQHEDATGLQTFYPRSNWPWRQDGRGRSYRNRSSMTVSTSTTRQDLSCHHPPRQKVAWQSRAAQREKR